MYRLTIFVLVSCVASQRLVAAVRRGESLSSRSNLYFDSYDRPSLQDYEELDDDLRDAVIMHPEQVLEVPPIPVERDYEMADLGTEEPLPEDRSYDSLWNSQLTRGFFHHLLEEIQTAFSKWPPLLATHPTQDPYSRYQFDSSLVDAQKTELKVLLATAEEKTCRIVVESEDSPQIIFMGTEGCSIQAVDNKIVIGYDCFEPTMIMKLIFKLFGFCEGPPLTFKANGRPLYIDSYRSKMQREAEENTDCQDQISVCSLVVSGNSSFPCSSRPDTWKSVCSRTCRICGDSCVDYRSDCNTHDVLKDCLSDWNQKKLGCAYTCGVCDQYKDSGVCVDYFGCCGYYAKRGYCQKLPDVMKKYCRLSCGYCKPKSCVDLRSDCSELKMLQGCQKMPRLMEQNCPRTCNFCGDGTENRDNEDRTPPENCSPDDEFLQKYCSWNPFIVV